MSIPTAPDNHDAHDCAERIRERLSRRLQELREAPAAEQSSVVAIPPGDHKLDGTKPLKIAWRTTVSAYSGA